MRYLFCTIVFCLISGVSFGQYAVTLDTQMNYLPSFQINSDIHRGASAQKVSLSATNYSVEAGLHLSRGYDSSIDFSYGFNAAKVFAETYHSIFKVGFEFDRFFVNDYKRSYEEIGSIIEDDITESFQPYLEWEWAFSRSVSLFTQTGYRIMTSVTRRVTDIKYETNPVTGEKTPVNHRTKETQSFYGSGFELGIGLSVIIY
ncbi:hypothetical protein [Fodinibius salsisoli]|uniref:Outer membrane protein beta-barrel domain-containing protein n=1 Tax=Fodinibius salsisoli TaxID=2820877 RepID=A0ABT3PPC2_9BACT|nr:hypothetical protein [Fodinibius salsisoli]MCW9707701.1 hypothetical protein [Fodinibius salsisoli]